MAEIHLSAIRTNGPGGPQTPDALHAGLVQREWPGGGTTPVLRLFVGKDTVEVWPADPETLRGLASKLELLACEIELRAAHGPVAAGGA